MRVIAGRYGGRRLIAPAGRDVRPTGDRVREALFAMLGDVTGTRVLDLFAGSGALGLEALSRGAATATFVDRAPAALRALRANLAALAVDAAELHRRDALGFAREAARNAHQYDLVFLDPPYRDAAALGPALAPLLPPVLASGARVVSESDRRAALELGLHVARERRYGDTVIRIHDHP
jgi:16S rRNA (guanine966-N2)-methyltransferase